jgi:pullulanase
MPYVFHRFDENKNWTNGSGCGCELDTEHKYVKRFVIDSLKFWLETYKVDGFRFDLMALYDIEIMKAIEKELREIRPDIILYGEPWVGGTSSLPYDRQFKKGNQNHGHIALFNDDFRNAIKGNNDGEEPGFINADIYKKNDIYAGCLGSINFSNSIIGFTSNASETVNYASSHDNLILMDKFNKSFHSASFEDKQNMNSLALSMILLSFGIPFIQAGTEFLRSKYGHHNSYNAGNYINRIDWSYKLNHRHVFDYTKKLIDFRKSQKVFSLSKAEDIKKAVKIKGTSEHVILYEITSPFKGDHKKILIGHNGGSYDEKIKLDSNNYDLVVDGALYYRKEVTLEKDELIVPRLSSVVCVLK